MNYVLAPHVRIGFDSGKLFLGFGSIQKVIIDPLQQRLLLAAAQFLLTPRSEREVEEYLTDKYESSSKHAKEIMSFLINGNYLMDPLAYNRDDRYSRHALYYSLSGGDPFIVQNKLLSKHVLIIGCGGIGNQISCALATAGIGKLTLVDFDIIEISNLTRQILFTESDAGMYKTEVLKRELLRRNSEIQINTIHTKINDLEEGLPNCDLAVISADSSGIVDKFNEYAIKKNVPFINVGYVQDIAVWGPFVIPKKTGCMACRNIVSTKRGDDNPDIWNCIRDINKRSQAPSIGPINMLAAAYASLDILRYLGEYGTIASLNKRIGMWTHNMTIETQDCSRESMCPVCGDAHGV